MNVKIFNNVRNIARQWMNANHKGRMLNPGFLRETEGTRFRKGQKFVLEITITDDYFSHLLWQQMYGRGENQESGLDLGYKIDSMSVHPSQLGDHPVQSGDPEDTKN